MTQAKKKQAKKRAPKAKAVAKPSQRVLSDDELEKVAGGAAIGSATGSTTVSSGHQGWIEVNSFQWGVGRGIASPGSSSADSEGTIPSVSEIVIKKP